MPLETLQEAVRLASESEDALAVVLRHIEENVSVPPQEWRRIHGSLALLARMISGGATNTYNEPLIGHLWFEAKMQERLKALMLFEHPEDRRVAVLVRRAAATAQTAAERHILAEHEGEECLSGKGSWPSSPKGALTSSLAADRAPGSLQALPRTANPQDGSRAQATVIGRTAMPAAEASAPAAASVTGLLNAANALEALNDPGTRDAAGPAGATSAPLQEAPAGAGAPAQELTPPRRCCCWLWHPGRPPAQQVETDASECETNSLLVDARVQPRG